MERILKTAFAREAAAGGMVLLKNDNGVLPLAKDAKVALFGRPSYYVFRMGSGSGDMLAQPPRQIYQGLEDAGISVHTALKEHSLKWHTENIGRLDIINRNWFEWTNIMPEIPLDEALVDQAAAESDVAILTIGRCCGEDNDLRLEKGSFYLSDEEEALVKLVNAKFKKTVLLLNVGSMIDLSIFDTYSFDAILYTALAGETSGDAIADLLTGRVTPSAKMAATWAKKYEDYPTTKEFGGAITHYSEGIYVGYRYFDTFNVEPRYAFGYGLSYTSFDIAITDIRLDGTVVDVSATVKNTGNYAGREVVQCYLSAPDGKLEKAYQDLVAYIKTDIIAPGESEDVVLSFDLTDHASFLEDNASYILEPGKYIVRVGNSSRNTHVAGAITLAEEVTTVKACTRLAVNMFHREISKKDATPYTYAGEAEEIAAAKELALDPADIELTVFAPTETNPPKLLTVADEDKDTLYTLDDVLAGRATVEQVVAQMDSFELASFVNGAIYEGAEKNATVGSMAKKVHGAAGETWSSEKYAIPANACADGPSGIRLSVFGSPVETDTDMAHLMVAFPSGTILANSWDLDAARKLGACVKDDMDILGIEGWLAPGLNIQRNPLNGRNFEYYSEDPLISGRCAAYVTYGVQCDDDGEQTGFYTTIKHLAANNSDCNRGYCDSIISERALREIYLKGFQIAVEEAQPHALMTSYNMINGMYCSTNYDLLTGILRGEWGFDGMVMTDWNCAGAPSLFQYAGNDLVMPGNSKQPILRALETGAIDRASVQKSVCRILELVLKTNFVKK